MTIKETKTERGGGGADRARRPRNPMLRNPMAPPSSGRADTPTINQEEAVPAKTTQRVPRLFARLARIEYHMNNDGAGAFEAL